MLEEIETDAAPRQRRSEESGRFERGSEEPDEDTAKRKEGFERMCRAGQFGQVPLACDFPVSVMSDSVCRTFQVMAKRRNTKTGVITIGAKTVAAITGRSERTTREHIKTLVGGLFLSVKVKRCGRLPPVYGLGPRVLSRMGDKVVIKWLGEPTHDEREAESRPEVQTAGRREKVRPEVQTAGRENRPSGSTGSHRVVRPEVQTADTHRDIVKTVEAEPPPTPENTPLDNVGNPPAVPGLDPDRPDPRNPKAALLGGDDPEPVRSIDHIAEVAELKALLGMTPTAPKPAPTPPAPKLTPKDTPRKPPRRNSGPRAMIEDFQACFVRDGADSRLSGVTFEALERYLRESGPDGQIAASQEVTRLRTEGQPLEKIGAWVREQGRPPHQEPEPPAPIAVEPEPTPQPAPAAVVGPDGRGELKAPGSQRPGPAERIDAWQALARERGCDGFLSPALRDRLRCYLETATPGEACELEAKVRLIFDARHPLMWINDDLVPLEREKKGERHG